MKISAIVPLVAVLIKYIMINLILFVFPFLFCFPKNCEINGDYFIHSF